MSTGPDITSLLSRAIENFIKMDIVILEGDRYVDQALEKMKEKDVRSVLVSHMGEVVGIVSKTDILFKVMSQGRNPGKVKLREIMTSPVLAVGPHSTVQETLAMMDKHIVRQLIVTAQSAVLGMVYRDDIFERIHMATITTADTALKGTPVCIINPKAIAYIKNPSTAPVVVCPYCDLTFDSKEALSKHIDRIHTGLGVLEGDVRRTFE